MTRRRLPLLLASLFALTAAVSTAATSATAASRVPTSRPPTSPNPGLDNFLSGVSAISGSDVWAVGYDGDINAGTFDTLILHWNGTTWQQVTSPNPSATTNQLYGVSAASSTDVWAAGAYASTSGNTTLIEHWNGTNWVKKSPPNPTGGNNVLYGVSADSSTDAWAVGLYYNVNTAVYSTLTLHWNGTSWKKVTSPNLPGATENTLRGVTAFSSTDAWAAGSSVDGSGVDHTLILHWNGTTWTRVASTPNPGTTYNKLFGISEASANDVWAVGWYDQSGLFDSLALHWNGVSWKQVKSPNPTGTTGRFLQGVDARTSSDVWSAGSVLVPPTQYQTFTIHWTGTKWSRIASPNPSSSNDALFGVSADSSTDAWSVGYAVDGGGHYVTLALRWNGTSWSVT